MNRRSFFRLGAGLAGTVAVAPKLLVETVPVAADVNVDITAAFGPAVTAGFAGNVFDFPVGINFYSQLVRLCNQFFPAGFWTITEDYERHIVNIEASVLNTEDLFFFKKGLWCIRPIGVLVKYNEQDITYTDDFFINNTHLE